VKIEKPKRITRGLRFRLTVSYALFFTLLLAAVGMIFRGFLTASLDQNIRDGLDQEWAAMKGFLQIKNGQPDWDYDRDDEDDAMFFGHHAFAFDKHLFNAKAQIGKTVEPLGDVMLDGFRVSCDGDSFRARLKLMRHTISREKFIGDVKISLVPKFVVEP